MSHRIDVSICMVSWNSEGFLTECLTSIKENLVGIKYEVVLVDNASTDGTVKRVQQSFPYVQLIVNGQNAGFAAANNIAIAQSSGRYILLLNPDAVLLNAGSVEEMVAFMDARPEAGACGPRLVHPHSGKAEVSARAFPQLLPLLWNLSYLDRLLPKSRLFGAYRMTYESVDKPRQVDWLTGACLMVRREAVATVGGLDEHIFMYCEDIDWCYRLKQAGWQICYLPLVEIGHYRGQSSKLKLKDPETKLGIWAAQQYTRSILYFYEKHYGNIQTGLLRLVVSTTAVLKAGMWLLVGTFIYNWDIGSGRARSYLSMIPVAARHRCFLNSCQERCMCE